MPGRRKLSLMRFFGYDLDLTVETIIDGDGGPRLFTGRDVDGIAWVIAQVADEPSHQSWLCAPVSDRAASVIVDRAADPRDAIRHSLTGTVELVTIEQGLATPDRCLLCSDVPEDFLGAVEAPAVASLAS